MDRLQDRSRPCQPDELVVTVHLATSLSAAVSGFLMAQPLLPRWRVHASTGHDGADTDASEFLAKAAFVCVRSPRRRCQQKRGGTVVVLDDPAELAGWGGVGSVVLSGDPMSHFARAVDEAAQGRVWISDHVAPRLPEAMAGRPPAELLTSGTSHELTPAEAETLSMVLSGYSNAEISSGRGVSVNTVRSCMRSILRKFGCSRRQDLLALALEADAGRRGAGRHPAL